MSCVVQQLARDAELPLKLCILPIPRNAFLHFGSLANTSSAILSVPSTSSRRGMTKPEDSPFPSMAENALAPCLNWKRVSFFAAVAEKSVKQGDWEALPRFWRSPIEAESLDGICDTFIATAGCDPLRDEGEAYGRRLVEAGVRVTMRRYTGVPHPWMHMVGVKKAQMYIHDTCLALKYAHGL